MPSRRWSSRVPSFPATSSVLDFLTPLSILPATPRTLSAFDGPALFRLISDRLRRWYGEYADAVLSPFRSAFEEAVLLPWFWQYVEFHHRSKSHSGRQFVCGMQGPLYVRGNLARLLPLCSSCRNWHLGPKRGAGSGSLPHKKRPSLHGQKAGRNVMVRLRV